jgi:hypothetical protein
METQLKLTWKLWLMYSEKNYLELGLESNLIPSMFLFHFSETP